MKKLYLLLLLILMFAAFIPQKADAKIWTKDLVDKVTLDSGYKFQICTIDFKYDFNAVKDAGFLSAEEKTFAANPDAYPCNKESMQDVLLANITLNFSKTNWNGGSAPEKLILLQDGLYSIDNYGDILSDETTKDPVGDISPLDWFSTLPAGISAIRGSNLNNTDPNLDASKKNLSNSGILILHDPKTGKFSGALFVINNVVYKVSNIVSQVTVPATLVDYTSSDNVTDSSDDISDWKTYENTKLGFSLKYPSTSTIKEYSDRNISMKIHDEVKPGHGGQGEYSSFGILYRDNESIDAEVLGNRPKKDTVVNEYLAIEIADSPQYMRDIWIKNPTPRSNGVIITLNTTSLVSPYDKEDFEVFNKIISTFKFTQ